MAVQIVKAKMYQRRDTTENWLKYNPVLASGEFGYDINKKKYKIGDGITKWSDLQFSYIGEVTDENGEILKYYKVATEEFVTEHITSSVVFSATKAAFPSIGDTDKLYIELESNMAYIWDNDSLTYEPIGTNVTLPDEQLIPIVENAVDLVLVDKLDEKVPPIVIRTLNESVLDGGDSESSSDEEIIAN